MSAMVQSIDATAADTQPEPTDGFPLVIDALKPNSLLVIFNNNGICRGTDVNPSGGPDVATTVFVKDSRYDKMMEAFGGVGVNATTPDELKRAVNEAMDSGRPTLINAVIDPAAGSKSGRISTRRTC